MNRNLTFEEALRNFPIASPVSSGAVTEPLSPSDRENDGSGFSFPDLTESWYIICPDYTGLL